MKPAYNGLLSFVSHRPQIILFLVFLKTKKDGFLRSLFLYVQVWQHFLRGPTFETLCLGGVPKSTKKRVDPFPARAGKEASYFRA